LAAGLSALASDPRVEIVFVAVKGVWAVVYARLRRPSLVLSRIAVLEAHVIVGSRIGPVWLHVIRRTVVANVVVAIVAAAVLICSGIAAVIGIVVAIVAAAVLIDSGIAAVDVAVNDLVVYAGAILPGRPASRPAIVCKVPRPVIAGATVSFDPHVVFLNVVVPHVPVDRVVAIDVVDVHASIDDRSIDVDISVAVVDVDVASDIDALAAATDPTAIPTTAAPAFTPPPGVVDATPTAAVAPAKIKIEPSPDGKADAKGHRGPPVGTAIVDNCGIVDRDVDVIRLVRSNRDVIVVLQNFFLGRRI